MGGSVNDQALWLQEAIFNVVLHVSRSSSSVADFLPRWLLYSLLHIMTDFLTLASIPAWLPWSSAILLLNPLWWGNRWARYLHYLWRLSSWLTAVKVSTDIITLYICLLYTITFHTYLSYICIYIKSVCGHYNKTQILFLFG